MTEEDSIFPFIYTKPFAANPQMQNAMTADTISIAKCQSTDMKSDSVRMGYVMLGGQEERRHVGRTNINVFIDIACHYGACFLAFLDVMLCCGDL